MIIAIIMIITSLSIMIAITVPLAVTGNVVDLQVMVRKKTVGLS